MWEQCVDCKMQRGAHANGNWECCDCEQRNSRRVDVDASGQGNDAGVGNPYLSATVILDEERDGVMKG